MSSQIHQFDPDLQGRPQLNFDVLRLVCNSLTDVSDVLSFARTCSELTEDAFRRRLRMSPINLKDEESVDSFRKFIFADEAARGPNIYGLKLPDPSHYDYDTSNARYWTIIERIIPILQAAVHLKYIDFPCASNYNPPHPALTVAANMTSLRELHIMFEGFSPWKLLGTFRSPLRSLCIDLGDVDDIGVSARLFHDHLANFAPTLEALELQFILVDLAPSLVTTQFTAVRSLTIDFIPVFDQFTVELLLRLFPNLDTTLALYSFEAEDVSPRWRELSMEAQKDHSWRRLDHVYGDAELIFLMALQCPIRRMDVWVSEHEIKRYLAPALRHNYPQHLHCVVSVDDGLGDLDEPFEFPSEGAEKLTHLVMFVNAHIGRNKVKPRTEAPSWSQFKDALITSIRHLRLTHLRLVFHYAILEDDWERDSRYIAHETDLQPAATELARAIPTLQYIFLTTCGNTTKLIPRQPFGFEHQKVNQWLAAKAWGVVHSHRCDHDEHHPGALQPNASADADASEVSCTELSRSAAERIMDREELDLPGHEEDQLRECHGDSAT